ncbi:hypothetical protein [Spiroplasma poulsonii]|uniref:hypothetical protein n=1 Tax=Spiroplasma poulsonii TaxID=2138 RepID=UPI001F4CD305|nr:hypothetical protein [Spiroplasma poulsonii]UNF61766.1 hypothetical protein MNU24_07600 [Spiroplasma poulsonii]
MKILLIKTWFQQLVGKRPINDYFNDKLLLMPPKTQSNAQKTNNLYSGKKKNTRSKHKYHEQETKKNTVNKLLWKKNTHNQNPNFKKYQN